MGALLDAAFGLAVAAVLLVGLPFVVLRILAPNAAATVAGVASRVLQTISRGYLPPSTKLPQVVYALEFRRVDRRTLVSTIRNVTVTLEVAGNNILRIRAGEIDPAIALRRQGLAANMGKAFSGLRGEAVERADFTIGSPAFDDRVVVRGPELLLRAALTPGGRASVLLAIEAGFAIENGSVTYDAARVPAEDLERLVTIAVDAASALRIASNDVIRGLSGQIRSETEKDVVLRCLECLVKERLADRETLRIAMADDDWRVSTFAAEALGDEGRPALIEALEDDTAPDPPRLLALDALVRTALPAVFLPVLRARVGDVSYDVRKRAQQALGAARDREALPILLDRLWPAADWEKASIAEAIGPLGDPAGARALRALLANATAGPVAAAALAEIGELEDVERLRAWANEPNRDRAHARAALASIARIQARHGGTSGELALSDAAPAGGAVSIPDAEAGALSEAPAKPRSTKQPA